MTAAPAPDQRIAQIAQATGNLASMMSAGLNVDMMDVLDIMLRRVIGAMKADDLAATIDLVAVHLEILRSDPIATTPDQAARLNRALNTLRAANNRATALFNAKPGGSA